MNSGGAKASSFDPKCAHAGHRLHRPELQPGLLETRSIQQFHQFCPDLPHLAIRPGEWGQYMLRAMFFTDVGHGSQSVLFSVQQIFDLLSKQRDEMMLSLCYALSL